MPPKSDLAQEQQKFTESRRAEGVKKTGAEFARIKPIEQLLFAPPDSPEESFVRRKYDRLHNANEGHVKLEAQARLLISQNAERVFGALRKKCEDAARTRDETEIELEKLDGYLRMIGVLGQELKTVESPYKIDAEAPAPEVLDTSEAVILKMFAEHLSRQNTEELLAMIEEDQEFITMLLEQTTVRDPLPTGANLSEADSIEVTDEKGMQHKERVNKFDKKKNPHYWHNMERLVYFISAKTEPGGKEKSKSRIRAEFIMWTEIVRNMDFGQKSDLAFAFAKNGDPGDAKDFILACVTSGAMSKEDVVKMQADAAQDNVSPLRGIVTEDFIAKNLEYALKARGNSEMQLKEQVRRVEQVYVGNAAAYFITFPKLLAGRVSELGALTAVLNTAFDIADRVRRRNEPSRRESLGKALALGTKDALTNKYTIGGVAAAIWGSNVVYPWVKAKFYGPSEEEKNVLLQSAEGKKFIERMAANIGREEYFIGHYDDFLRTAKRHQDNPDAKNEFALYPADIELTAQEAGALGYESVNAARADLIWMFNAASRALKIPSGAKLDEFIASAHKGTHEHEHNDAA